MKRSLLVGSALVLSMMLFLGCGGGQGGEPKDGEQSSDEPARIDVTDRSDDRVEFEIEHEEHGTMSGVGSTGVPDDFPLPVDPEWGVLTAGFVDMPNGRRWVGSFTFAEDLQALAERYEAELRAIGIEVQRQDIGAAAVGLIISGTLDGQPAEGTVSIGVAGDQQIINITYGASID